MIRNCLAAGLLFFLSSFAYAENWAEFRGSDQTGVTKDSAPIQWSAEENILWKAPLPHPGNGSPIIFDGKIFVTSAEDADGKSRSLICFDSETGKQLWKKSVRIAKKMPTHKTNPYCGTTPAASGNHVVVWHGSAGLHCYDLQGKKVWSRNLGEFRHMWGYGTSPIIENNRIFLNSGPGDKVWVAAFELETGKTIWQKIEPQDGTAEANAAGKYKGSWSTSIIAKHQGKSQLINVMPTRVVAHDPNNGNVIWFCEGVNHQRGDLSYSSAVIAGDICFVTGGFKGPSLAVRLTGKGNVTQTHRLWRTEKQPQTVGSAVVVDGIIYRPNAGPGILDCIDPVTGKTLWKQRGTGNYWASTIQAGEFLYATAQDTTTIVFKANSERFEEISRNRLEEKGTCNATPAVSNGRIYIRTFSHLYAIGK